jgi:hypothetical protein
MPEEDNDLTYMNERWAVVAHGGRAKVMSTLKDVPPEFYSALDFQLLYRNRLKMTDSGEFVRMGNWWLCHRRRRQYDSVEFAPGETLPPHAYNTWSGFAVEPAPGGYPLFQEHLYKNVVRENAEHYEFVMNWLADCVQNPGRPAEVAIGLQGRPGCGKGALVQYFGKIFGRHFSHVTQSDHLTGKHNGHLLECILLYADEAHYAGDPKHRNVLKTMITERTRLSEPKYMNAYPVRNCLHMFVASNENWFIPATEGERRFVVFKVGDGRREDHDFFNALNLERDNGGAAALLHDLMNRDLSGVDFRKAPVTEGLAEQQALGRLGIDGFIEDICTTGVIPCLAHPDRYVTGDGDQSLVAIGARELVNNRNGDLVYSKGLETYLTRTYPALSRLTHVQIRKEMIKDWGWWADHDNAGRGLRAPPLHELRELFEKKWGKQAWPSDITFWGEVPTGRDDEASQRKTLITPGDAENEIKREAASRFNVSPDDLDTVDPEDPSELRLPVNPDRRPTPRLELRRAQDTGKKILIVMTDASLRISDGRPTNVGGEEACGCYLALEKQGHTPVLLAAETSTPGSYRVAHDDVDVNEFDEMMINREGPNFIGGTVHERHLWTARALCKFHGRVSYYFCDPEMRKGEYLAAFLHDLHDGKGMKNYQNRPMSKKGLNDLISRSMLEDNLHKTSKETALVRSGYPCKPSHPIHAKRGFKGEIQFIDSWRMALFNIRKAEVIDVSFEELLKSACYVGNLKKARYPRLRELDLLDPSVEDEGLVKYYGKMSRVIDEMRGGEVKRLGGAKGAVELNSVSDTYGKHIAGLVIGHPDQRNTGLNHRYLQGLLVKRSMLIDHGQDERGHLCLDPKLRTALFFKDAVEYRERLAFVRIEKNYDEIIRRLNIEAERIRSESAESLVRRVRGE